jgi:diguanylate cyclase (GGDEF)-like protein
MTVMETPEAEVARLRAENASLQRALRAFLRDVERGIARVARHGTAMTLMFADLDGLKAINDRDGHQAGDAALIAVGYALKANARAIDSVARIGGDEFGMLFEDMDDAAAAAKAQLLAEAVSGDADTIVAISIGWARIRPDDTLDSLIARADAAMYAVKRGQRSAR